MSVNLTVDDSSLDIAFTNNWATQGNDPGSFHFFQSTYHAAQENGATANLTFTGSAIYLYGSMGPAHANYSVQFDDFEIFLSANAPTLQFQQPLFAYTFPNYTTHFVSLSALFNDDGRWLDIDYITITVDGGDNLTPVANHLSPATITPPWLTSTTASSTPVSSPLNAPNLITSSALPSSVSSASSSLGPKITLALSAIFGSILALIIITFLFVYFLRRRYDKKIQMEREFRYNASQNRVFSALNIPDPHPPPSPTDELTQPGSRFSVSVRDFPTPPVSPFSQVFGSQASRSGTETPSTSASGHRPLILPSRNVKRASLAQSLDPLHEQSEKDTSSPALLSPTVPPPIPPPPIPKRPSGNILGWATSGAINWDASQRPRHTGDANSMKTDFLQIE